MAGMRYASERADNDHDHLVKIPEFVRAPSQLQRNWLKNCLNAVVLTWAARFLYRNSPLNGSDNLQRWACTGYLATIRGFRCALRFLVIVKGGCCGNSWTCTSGGIFGHALLPANLVKCWTQIALQSTQFSTSSC